MTSDEVIERLRDWPFMGKAMATATADHIEVLIKERDEAWKRAAHAEKMWGEAEVRLTEVEKDAKRADAIWSDNYEALKAKLSKAVGALGDISNGEPEWPDDPQKELDWCRNRATTTLAELTGGKDG